MELKPLTILFLIIFCLVLFFILEKYNYTENAENTPEDEGIIDSIIRNIKSFFGFNNNQEEKLNNDKKEKTKETDKKIIEKSNEKITDKNKSPDTKKTNEETTKGTTEETKSTDIKKTNEETKNNIIKESTTTANSIEETTEETTIPDKLPDTKESTVEVEEENKEDEFSKLTKKEKYDLYKIYLAAILQGYSFSNIENEEDFENAIKEIIAKIMNIDAFTYAMETAFHSNDNCKTFNKNVNKKYAEIKLNLMKFLKKYPNLVLLKEYSFLDLPCGNDFKKIIKNGSLK